MLAAICKMLIWVLSHRIWAGIAVLVPIVLTLLANNSDVPVSSPGVYSLRSISVGEKLTADVVEVRGDGESVTHTDPMKVKDVIGLCLTKGVKANTQLTLTHLVVCTVSSN